MHRSKPELATTLADVLRARDLIDNRQHAAAERYRAARAQALAQSTGRLQEEGPVARYNELCGRLTEEQHVEVAALVLEQRPGWVRGGTCSACRSRLMTWSIDGGCSTVWTR